MDVAGLTVGDLILKINDKPVTNLEDIKKSFQNIEKDKPGYLSLFIKRNSGTQYLFVKTNFEVSKDDTN